MLILFDIDHTLLATQGVGLQAMHAAGNDLYGERFKPGTVDFAGRLDPLIIGDMLRNSGLAYSRDAVQAFKRAMTGHMARHLEPAHAARTLPGVIELLDHLASVQRARRDLHLGVLTGNFEPTGRMKLERCGIDPRRFHVFAWGDDSPNEIPCRADLVPVAMERDASLRGRLLGGHEVRVVGDTVHDVVCARAHGCESLAVATGRTGFEQLEAAGATRTVRDLSETADIARWLLRPV